MMRRFLATLSVVVVAVALVARAAEPNPIPFKKADATKPKAEGDLSPEQIALQQAEAAIKQASEHGVDNKFITLMVSLKNGSTFNALTQNRCWSTATAIAITPSGGIRFLLLSMARSTCGSNTRHRGLLLLRPG